MKNWDIKPPFFWLNPSENWTFQSVYIFELAARIEKLKEIHLRSQIDKNTLTLYY